MENLLSRSELHQYQKYCAEYIVTHPVSTIFLSCGLGKTVISLTAIQELLFDRFEIKKVLVICPLRVGLNVWKQECEKWEHLFEINCAVAIGSERERISALLSDAEIYILNRENVEWLVTKSGLPFEYDMVVIDELSSFKSHQSKRFKALRKVRPRVTRIVGLTGTPTPNGLMDLWAEIGILDMGQRLGRFIGGYRERYFLPDKRNQTTIFSYKPREGAEEAIYEKISDICISMKSMDYLQMPECVFNNVEMTMSTEEAELYERLKKDMILPFEDGDIDAKSSVGLSNKLLQMANGAVYDEAGNAKHIHDRKIDALEDLIEAANGKPVLIAYWFKHDLQRICERFPGVKLDTAADIAKWNAGELPIAIIHPASAGHGLNLQVGGSTLIWFGLTWSLELYQQTNARLWRQGQKNTVVIHHIITKGTIDEDVLRALCNKENTQAALIEAVKANLYSEGEKHNGKNMLCK